MKSVGVAIIGCGFAGNFHSNAWVKVYGVDVKLVCACDNDIKRAEALKEKWNYKYAEADFDKVLQDPEIDVKTHNYYTLFEVRYSSGDAGRSVQG